jgi:hypothetical protein
LIAHLSKLPLELRARTVDPRQPALEFTAQRALGARALALALHFGVEMRTQDAEQGARQQGQDDDAGAHGGEPSDYSRRS